MRRRGRRSRFAFQGNQVSYLRRGRTPGGLAAQHRGEQRTPARRQTRRDPWRPVDHAGDPLQRRTGVLRLCGERFQQDQPEREHIRSRHRADASRLLRRHVAGGPDDQAVGGVDRCVPRVRDPEVGEVDPAVGLHQDVGGLQIAVDDALRVDVRQRVGQGGSDPRDLRRRQRSAPDDACQILAVDQRHDEVAPRAVAAGVPQRDEVRMADRREQPRLLGEAPGEFRPALAGLEDLDRDRPPQVDVGGFVDLGRAAQPDALTEPIAVPEQGLAHSGKAHSRPITAIRRFTRP
ncbi:hypothetical protein Caci_7182 [Catenulispora acidiphila DSM 44928]|uniref:Uncharacterized protein n=1 Tax=Catenulispora acidiphila (strain DSM 44928 / JCM 14897 / NBRC 102108 / NRRL B-24433 / ID139908) TaxID=479433 RepID=C7Q6Z8_CATAD|nr:hypothetical protein Caci_7182 [Catenulispora acidiphila DSM 44928]